MKTNEKKKKVVVNKKPNAEKKNIIVKINKVVACTGENNVEDDVSNLVDDIVDEHDAKGIIKVFGGKKLHKNTHVVPLNNVSFHFKESVAKWKFIFHIRIALKRNF